ncbi:hypothetical protein TWF191_001209 [Orbilia oligospora]|uniref:Amidohydrolase 3 domain-containing protein n=1 Tax=Orbilia oligospora TaxID=2813651 RepID=A0A7C8V6T4_ORBOL|nr:hypothetical protein TWF191_001209 [Orbilia oligospora]
MRFLHGPSAGPLVLASFIFSLFSPSIAHPDHDEETGSCLTGYIKLAEIIFGKITPSDFDTSAVSRRFSHPEKRTSDRNVPIIFYSSSQQNRRPIITMANDRLSPVEALAIQEGKVIAVGSLASVRRKAGDRRIFRNLHKQVILPGFVEPHLHIMLSALLKGYFLDISPLRAPSFESAMQQLRDELKTLKQGEWLIAYGYDPSRLNWHDLSKEDLNKEVSSTTPIVVINASGHLAYANSLAFQEVGITKNTPNPEGGEYAKDPKTGELTGVLVESGAILQFSAKATLANLGRTGRVKEGLAKILGQWLAKGLTTVFDGGLGAVTPQDLETVANLTEVSPIRIRAAVADFKPGDAEKMLGTGNMPAGGFKRKGLIVKTVKLWSDGSTQGFTAAVKQNYLSEHFPTYFAGKEKGVLVWPDSANVGESAFNTTMYDEMLKWLNRGYQLMIHANGDRASDIVLGNFEKIFKRFGVLGKERAERIDPVKDDVNSGVIYSFNSDSPVTDADPLLWVGTAISRRVFKSNNILGKAQRVGLEDALKGVTSYPAKQILWEKEVGSLEAGKFADFVIVSRDLRCFDWERKNTKEIKVLETWIGGVRRYSAPGSV